MKLITGVTLLMFVSGCTIGVPKLVKCETGAQAIEQCGDVIDIADIVNVGDLEIKYLEQQQAYRECRQRHMKLVEMIASCNAAIDVHNENLDKLIQENALLFANDLL